VRKITIKSLLIFAILFIANTVVAQVTFNNVDQRLMDVYGKARVQQMMTDQPQFIDYMNYYVQNGYQIMYDVPERKLANFKDVSTITNTRTGDSVTANDIYDLNIMLLDIHRNQDEYLTYKVGETGTVVVFIAPKNLLEEYQMMKKTEGKR